MCQEFVSPLCAIESDFDGSAAADYSCFKMYNTEWDRDADCSSPNAFTTDEGQFYCYFWQVTTESDCAAKFSSAGKEQE